MDEIDKNELDVSGGAEAGAEPQTAQETCIGPKKGKTILKLCLLKALMFIAVCGVIIAVDQITKQLIYKNIFYGSSIVLIPRFLEISHVHNTGAAWGMFNQHTGILSAVTLAACAGLAFLYSQSKKKLFSAALLMVIGGALGNLIDRISRGFVIDFIRVWIFKYEFPNFNVADSCITVGCVLMIIAVMLSGRKNDDYLLRKESILGRLFEKERKKKEKPGDNQ
ncbi:MAG: signal peptidase II [Clostridia bacterium]|nr:signal peptidase II [Clostridia bacterium]